ASLKALSRCSSHADLSLTIATALAPHQSHGLRCDPPQPQDSVIVGSPLIGRPRPPPVPAAPPGDPPGPPAETSPGGPGRSASPRPQRWRGPRSGPPSSTAPG